MKPTPPLITDIGRRAFPKPLARKGMKSLIHSISGAFLAFPFFATAAESSIR
jgi:hypothetical protein